jgi:hypothetical protein
VPLARIGRKRKGRCTVGDKSPKSAQKQNQQKQAKLDQEKKKKQSDIFAKQSANNKKK